MRCGNCGSENRANAISCIGCGTSLIDESKPNLKRADKKFFIIAGAVVLLVAFVLLMCAITRSPRRTVSKYFDSIECGDAQAIVRLIPKKVREEVIGGEAEQELFIKTLQRQLNAYIIDMESSDTTYRYYINEVTEIQGASLREIRDIYRDRFDCYVTDASEVTVEVYGIYGVDWWGNLIASDAEFVTIRTVKMNGIWYIDILSFEDPS